MASQAAQKSEAGPEIVTEDPTAEPPYSVFSNVEKRLYAWVASVAAFASPVSAAIYFPALTTLAADLNTSVSKINLTITTYMIFQAVAPTFVGGFSDRWGRRPAYLFCFVVYIAANTGLALQNSYVALIILRCLQSSGSSGTTALANGLVSDVATRSERGSYIGLASLGSSLGPTLGPVIGGLLVHFLGWRSIFWFLDIFAGIILLVLAVFIPETCRNVVGNGSVPPQRWNFSLISYLHRRRQLRAGIPLSRSTMSNKVRPSILSSIPIIFAKESFLLLFFGGLLAGGFYIVMAGLATQLQDTYHYNSIQVGLCYVPMGVGAIASRLLSGYLIDRNFRRHAARLGIEIKKGRQTSLDNFPAEQARLEIALPSVYLGCVTMIAYGWVMNMAHPPLPAALVLLFFLILLLASGMQAVSVLIVDCHPDSPSAASAAGNLTRCLLGAGGVAVVQPLVNSIGRGWTSTLVAFIWLIFSPCWWACWVWGPAWRAERKHRLEEPSKSTNKVWNVRISHHQLPCTDN
ncbi:MAG: hypothetical protein M1818_001856 [Claussenomyces sp. TS43310]|nr:MAG: hypothetical protein M1818_001856 [Claussenomyces sp. TS43310]